MILEVNEAGRLKATEDRFGGGLALLEGSMMELGKVDELGRAKTLLVPAFKFQGG